MPNILDGALSTPVPPSTSNVTSSSNIIQNQTTSTTESNNPTLRDEEAINQNSTIENSQVINTSQPQITSTGGGQTLGFCYSCNRQNYIDISNYTCMNCNGGFVEVNNTSSINLEQDQTRRLSERVIDPLSFRPNTDNDPISSYIYEPIFRLIDHINANQSSLTSPSTNLASTNRFNDIFLSYSTPPGEETRLNEAERRVDNTETNESHQPPTNTNREQELDNEYNSFSRFRYSLRRNNSDRNRFNRMNNLNESERNDLNTYRDSLRSSSSSTSRRRSRSPPSFARHGFSRPFSSRSRFMNFLNDEDDIFVDHGAIIITTLINSIRNRGAAPASETQIQNLPIIALNQELLDNTTQCAVCMDDYVLNEEVKKLPCKHLFHDPCISQWLKLHGTCPVCRNNISGEDTSNEDITTHNLFRLDETGPTFLIPFTSNQDQSTSSNETNSATTRTATNTSNTTAATTTNNSNNSNILRNHQLYRIRIQNLISGHPLLSSSSSPNSISTPSNEIRNEENQNQNDSLRSRLRSSIRITTRLANQPNSSINTESVNQSTSSPTITDSPLNERFNLDLMMRQFMGRYRPNRQEESSSNSAAQQVNINSNSIGPNSNENRSDDDSLRSRLRSSIRITTRLTNPDQINTNSRNNTTNNNNRENSTSNNSNRYNFNHMMRQFISRYRTNDSSRGPRTNEETRRTIEYDFDNDTINENSSSENDPGRDRSDRSIVSQNENISDDDIIELDPRRNDLPQAKRRKT